MFRRYTRAVALCFAIALYSTNCFAQNVLFPFNGQISSCANASGSAPYAVTVGGLQGSQIDTYLQPGTGWELSAILLPETTSGHDLARLYQHNFYQLPRQRLYSGAGSISLVDPNGTIIAFELTYNQSLFNTARANFQRRPESPMAVVSAIPKGLSKQVPSRDRNRSASRRNLGKNLFSALYSLGGNGSPPPESILSAYGLSTVTRVSGCSYPPLSSLTRIAVIGGSLGDIQNPNSVDILRNKTATVPLTRNQAGALSRGEVKLLVASATSSWIDIPQVDPVLYYADGTPRLVKLTFTDEIIGFGVNRYAEKFVYMGPAASIHGRDAAGLSAQLQALLAFHPEFTIEAQGPRPGEKYTAQFPIDLLIPKDVVGFGSHNGTFRYAANLLPSGTMNDHLPQAGQAQLFMSSDFGELSHLKLSVAFVNSIASDNGRGYDDLYLKSLRLCAKNATSFSAWNPVIETLNRNLYLYGTPVQIGDRLCLPLLPENGGAHLFQAGQVTPFLDISVGFDGLSGRAQHLASGNTRYVTLNTLGSENSFYSLPYLFGAGIPDATRAGKTPAQIDYEASRAYHFIRPSVSSLNECVGGVCNIDPQFYSVLAGPPGGNTTGGGDIDFAKADATILHNARGSEHIGKVIDVVTIHSIAQLQRELADGLVTPTGEINTLDRVRATFSGQFKYNVSSLLHSVSSWNPRFNGSRAVVAIRDTYLRHRAAGQLIAEPYENALRSFEPHNFQHIIRMVPDVLAVGLSTGDPVIGFFNQALGETILTAHYWDNSWYPTGSFRLERNHAVNNPGEGTGLGRNMEVLPLIAEAAARYQQIPNRYIAEFTSLFAEMMDYAPTAAGLYGEFTLLDPRTGSTAERDAFRTTMAARCGFNFANTEIVNATYVWQQLLLGLSAAHVIDRFEGHLNPTVQGQVQSIETALVNGLLAQHDPTVAYKNGFPVWALYTSVRDTSTNQMCQATAAEQIQHANEYTAIDLYWRQTVAPYLVNYPQTRSTILSRIPVSMVRGGTFDLETPSTLIGSWAGQRIGRQ